MARNINELSSCEAVLAAIEECDEQGRDVFLSKYGYKRARKYSLIYKDREYDSKAIAGVAYGKQYGTPLSAHDFNGGVAGALVPLLKLGFEFRGVEDDSASDSTEKRNAKNPAWSRDELILALHLYLHNRESAPGKNSPQVKDLSELLGKMSKHSNVSGTYRNPTGVYMKLMNFRSLDGRFEPPQIL